MDSLFPLDWRLLLLAVDGRRVVVILADLILPAALLLRRRATVIERRACCPPATARGGGDRRRRQGQGRRVRRGRVLEEERGRVEQLRDVPLMAHYLVVSDSSKIDSNTYSIARATRDADLVVTTQLVSRGLLGDLLEELEAALRLDGGVLDPVDELVQLGLEVAQRSWGQL